MSEDAAQKEARERLESILAMQRKSDERQKQELLQAEKVVLVEKERQVMIAAEKAVQDQIRMKQEEEARQMALQEQLRLEEQTRLAQLETTLPASGIDKALFTLGLI